MCTLDVLQEMYDPANIACGQTEAGDSGGVGVAEFQCPQPGTTVKCMLTIGWGSVAGTCTTCSDACSLGALSGEDSCCGTACTQDGSSGDCQNNAWIPTSAGGCGSEYSDGHCDCCPSCDECLSSSLGSDQSPPGSGVDSRFCDCRNGLETSLDWTPCWNSCMDCFGDNAPGAHTSEQPALFSRRVSLFIGDRVPPVPQRAKSFTHLWSSWVSASAARPATWASS